MITLHNSCSLNGLLARRVARRYATINVVPEVPACARELDRNIYIKPVWAYTTVKILMLYGYGR